MHQKSEHSYYPQLDSLRAIAVILVILSHWFSKDHFINRYSENGILGVTLFFVLSGFLITGILLKSKEKIATSDSAISVFKVFYIRRALRIFPVYYLLLFVLLLLDLADISKTFWWHFYYGSNVYYYFKGAFAGNLSHMWSLSVEEQFYLIWPTIILLIPRGFLTPVFIVGIVTGISFRLLMITDTNEMGRFLMPGSLDSFCIGGLFAFGREHAVGWYKKYLQSQQFFLFIAFILIFVVHMPFFRGLPVGLRQTMNLFFISVAFGILIDRATFSVEVPILKQLLNNKLLLYIGKISYGIYLFHNFIPYFFELKIRCIPDELVMYIVQTLRLIVLLLASTASWYLIEKPFLKMKNKYISI
jgi:peptidoglycan/LPS O-acetylase OafA/YrhL